MENKTPFMVELNHAYYDCTVTHEDGTPRGCRVRVVGKRNTNGVGVYGYVRVESGPARKHGPHEDACERAAEVNAGWGAKEISQFSCL